MDIQTYLDRIRYTGSLQPDLATLNALQHAHLCSVPFENIDVMLGIPIVPDLDAFYEKIVVKRRGGFCYELNGLFAWLLRELGFKVDMLNARVIGDNGQPGPPFDHMTLLVTLADPRQARWLADVGFGDTFQDVLWLDDPEPRKQEFGEYRIARQGSIFKLQSRIRDDDFKEEYWFDLRPHELFEFADTCLLQQTPASHFTQKRICTLATPTGRITLSERRLIITDNGQRSESLLESEDACRALLRERFGVDW